MNERHFRLYERIVAIEDSLEALGPIDKLIERIEELEKMVKQTKTVLGFDEACKYIGVSESLLYKLTAAKEVPHYKPRGKMLYFNREEIDKFPVGVSYHKAPLRFGSRPDGSGSAVLPQSKSALSFSSCPMSGQTKSSQNMAHAV